MVILALKPPQRSWLKQLLNRSPLEQDQNAANRKRQFFPFRINDLMASRHDKPSY